MMFIMDSQKRRISFIRRQDCLPDSCFCSGGKTGYLMPVKLSSDLADIVGAEELPRGEVNKNKHTAR